MAVGRYLAVSYPFHVKPLIDLRCTRSTITAIFAVSFLVNVPRFFENTVQSIPAMFPRRSSFKVTAKVTRCGSLWSIHPHDNTLPPCRRKDHFL